MIEKDTTNNAIVVKLANVRKHPNADRLKLATVLGTQVVVGLDSQDGDLVIYFDSNLRLSHEYLHYNSLYSNKELNVDQNVRGYFGKNGRVRSQKFRGEVSNGYVASIDSLMVPNFINYNCELIKKSDFKEGDEFTTINGVKICEKYLIPFAGKSGQQKKPKSRMFHRHWDTKQLMRELDSIPANAICYIEEKIHGTSGRTAHVLCPTNRKWWQFWKPTEEWRVVSGTRRVDDIDFHLPQIRQEIESKIAPHLHKGEEIYYEIYGNELTNCPPCKDNSFKGGVNIQKGFPYDCRPGEYKCMLYRVTITTPDGFCIDMDREYVYKRAEELGLVKPYLLDVIWWANDDAFVEEDHVNMIRDWCEGKSFFDCNTLLEGVVVWFKDRCGQWTCLKHKSEEFLMDQDKKMEKEQGDVEDNL